MKRDYLLENQPAAALRSSARLLPIIVFLLLAINAAISAYKSRHNPSALAFMAFAYSDLAVLFLCLRKFEKRQGPEAPPPEERARLKAAVWTLATALELAFAWRVAKVLPPAVGIVVKVMAGAVAVGGFYGLFVFREADAEKAAVHVSAPAPPSETRTALQYD